MITRLLFFDSINAKVLKFCLNKIAKMLGWSVGHKKYIHIQ